LRWHLLGAGYHARLVDMNHAYEKWVDINRLYVRLSREKRHNYLYKYNLCNKNMGITVIVITLVSILQPFHLFFITIWTEEGVTHEEKKLVDGHSAGV
jgi:hypothetical protein